MTIEVVQFNAAQSNFGLLIHDPEAGVTAAVDSADWKAVAAEADGRGWPLTHILITHHHADHTDGLAELKAKYGCAIHGPAAEAEKIRLLDRTFHDGDRFTLGNVEVLVLATPGHTAGHVSYYIAEAGLAFVGDTLFSLGCGRLFEGTPAMMWHSLQKLAALPPQTLVYCGHEYTADNARFALTIEPNNLDLVGRAEEVQALVAAGKPTLPVTIGDELKANPFLRADKPRLKRALGMTGADPVAVFAEIRGRKDNFK
jgi:hydroxyacylglutathione hydrolase